MISEPKLQGRLADFFIRLWKEKPLGTVCGVIVLLFIVVAIFAEVLAPYPFDEVHLPAILKAPSVQYLLGADQLGRDLLSRLIFGARVSMLVGLAATTLNVVVATLIGGISGFLGGKLDLAVQRFVDAWMAFPGLLLLLTIMSIVGQGLFQLILVLGISGGIVGSRVVRGAVIGVKEHDSRLFSNGRLPGGPRREIRHVVLPKEAHAARGGALDDVRPARLESGRAGQLPRREQAVQRRGAFDLGLGRGRQEGVGERLGQDRAGRCREFQQQVAHVLDG